MNWSSIFRKGYPKKALRSLLCLVLLLCTATACFSRPISDDEGEGDFTARIQVEHLTDEQVEWLLAGPEGQWCPELLAIARRISKGDDDAAEKFAQSWIERDFKNAFLMLPGLNEIISQGEHSALVELFAQGLDRLKGSHRMKLLAMLKFSNIAVRKVGVRTMRNWWQTNRTEFKQWISETPCFFEEGLNEEFIVSTVEANAADGAELADVFLALKTDDVRRTRCFELVMDRWARLDKKVAFDFIESRHEQQKNRYDPAIERVTWQMSYLLANEKDFARALSWVSKVKDRELKELAVRDHSSSVTQESQKAMFLQWLDSYSFESSELENETKNNLKNLNSNADQSENE